MSDGTAPPSAGTGSEASGGNTGHPQQSPWWARDAATDPWRNPSTHAVVTHTPEPTFPPTEPPIPPAPKAPGLTLGTVITVSAVVAVLAGMLGALLGVIATKPGQQTTGTFSPNGSPPPGSYQEKIEQILPSVVTIWVSSGGSGGNGSGFVYSPEGYIVTNQHVAGLAEEDNARMEVQFSDGRIVPAELVGEAKSTDIAVIKVDGSDLPALSVADSNEVMVGDRVMAVGAPLGLSHTVTEGIVSALDRPVISGDSEKEATVTAAIQTDAAINPGNSGGPLINMDGSVIGVNTSIYTFANEDGEGGSIGLGFAIPSNQFKRIVDELIDTGTATKTVLGAKLKTTPNGTLGATVESVEQNTPAAESGLAGGDRIVAFNGQYVTDDVHLRALILRSSPGESVTLTVDRGGSEQDIDVTLAASPDE